jgi:NADPH-dependent 2,4-dienoyl-CoA reductase/sulfur reductase-like enzyme/nitrite reductase/ring-hydroxylating ferredoxin subunit
MADTKRAVAKLDEIQEGELRLVEQDGEEILLTKSHGKICACGNSCSHYGAPLTDGWMEDGEIVCPWHYAKFDPASGERRTPPALDDLPLYETEIVGDEILLGAKHAPEIPLPSGSDSRTILIVGGGAAGQAAAETLRREGFAGAITLISAEDELPYDRTALSKGMLSGKADPAKLALRNAQFYERLKIELKLGSRVSRIDTAAKEVILEDGSRLAGEMILLATGSRPRRLPIPGADSEGVHLIRELKEARKLAGELSKAGRVAVIGAGFISLEAAANLRERGVDVDVIAPEKLPLEGVFGAEAASRIAEIHRAQGVRFHLGTTVTRISRLESGYTLELADRSSLETDLILMAVGVEPVLDYLQDSGLDHENGVAVNERFETAAAGIFAAGDIARFPYASGSAAGVTRSEHWINSQMQGVHAARAMLGSQAPFGEVPLFWSKQYGYSFKFAGFAEKYDQTVIHGSLAKDSWIAGYYRQGRLRAVSGFGKGKAIYKLRSLIGRGENVSIEDFSVGKF